MKKIFIASLLGNEVFREEEGVQEIIAGRLDLLCFVTCNPQHDGIQ